MSVINSAAVLSVSTDFDGNRWYSNDFDNASGAGGIVTNALSAGTFTYGIAVTGSYGTVRVSSSTSANSGGLILSNQAVTPKQSAATRFLFSLESAQSTRQARCGFIGSGSYIASETNGAFIEINDQTVTAVAVSAGTTTTQGSSVLPLNALLVCDVYYISDTSVRYVVFQKSDNTVYFDQTVTTNVPTSVGLYQILKATSSGVSAIALIVVDYVGHGKARPPYIQTPV